MKIEKSIKKIGIAVGAILLVIIFFVVFKMFDGNENSDRIVGNPFSQEKIEHKIYFKDMGNDWYYYFSIYSIDGKINHKFDGFNLKYASSLEYGNNPYYYIEHGPKSENVLLCGDPELKCSRKFNTVISEQDEIKKFQNILIRKNSINK